MSSLQSEWKFRLPILTTCNKYLIGLFFTLLLYLFNIITIPIFLFRYVAAYLAKTYRPDLGNILQNLNAFLAADLLQEKPSRANNILTLVIKGKVEIDEVKESLQKQWITNAKTLSYEKFTQYPVHYMGFTFWKHARDTFQIDNYVTLLYPKDRIFTETDLDNVINKLMNCKFPPKQSPWQVFLVQNYQSETTTKETHCLIIFKWHHCLSDGYGVMLAMLEGFFEDFTMDKLQLPNIQFPKRQGWEKFWFMVTLPIRLFVECCNLSALGVSLCPFKVPDSKKHWHQVCVRTKPILIEDVKRIKNCVGVSYTSVLLSAISAAVDKTLNSNPKNTKFKKIVCGSALPMPGPMRSPGLTNFVTAALFGLPVGPFENTTQRLKATHKMLQNIRNTVAPYIFYWFAAITGNHTHYVTSLFYNRHCGIGLTNFAGAPTKLGREERTLEECHTVAGCGSGQLGVAITAVSHNKHVYIAMSVERGLMSKEEAQRFLDLIPAEIQQLKDVVYYKNF